MKSTALICVTRNQADLLKVTIDSILRCTSGEEYDLYVIDNASTDGTHEVLSTLRQDHLIHVRNNRNLNWVKGVNQGLELTRGYRHVALLNSDIEVGPGWLTRMLAIKEEHPQVGAVGPLTSTARDWQFYDNVRDLHPSLNLPALQDIDRNDVKAMQSAISDCHWGFLGDRGMLAFFCTLIRRSAIDQIGYLDEDFNDLFLGDDDDFCSRLIASGHLVALNTNTYVAHRSGSSSLGVPGAEERRRRAAELLQEKRRQRTS